MADFPDELPDDFRRWRQAPISPDPAAVVPAFETRVLARMRAERAGAGLRWFWRWSMVFGAAAAVCVILAVQSSQALADDPLAALDVGGAWLAWWF